MANRRKKLSQRLLAIHEAGHAIASELLGIPVDHVTIEPSTPLMYGYAMQSAKAPPDKQDLINAAGDTAVTMYRQNGMAVLDQFIARNQEQRFAQVREQMERVGLDFDPSRDLPRSDMAKFDGSEKATDAIFQAHFAAWDLLRPHFPKVRALADLLLTLGTVPGERVRQIMHTKNAALAVAI